LLELGGDWFCVDWVMADLPKLCSAEHLQVLRKEIEKKNKINVTRCNMFLRLSENAYLPDSYFYYLPS
jgi:hypothetical protein